MTLAGALRARQVAPAVARENATYAHPPKDIDAFQLARFNAGWAQSLARSPFARAMQTRLSLPEAFESWAEVHQRVPVQTKASLRPDLTVAGAAEPLLYRATGGTTSEPLRFPVFRDEAQAAGHDLWVGRARLGITPADPLFMIWGHAQMFGVGPKASLIWAKRRLYDAFVGYTRWNAYRMSPADLRAAGDALLKSGARYVLGYSCALDRFARANLDRAAAFSGLGLKAVIATAEGFPFADSAEVISQVFGAPAIMEYGSVETGPIAYQNRAGAFDVFWARHRLEVADDGALIVTALSTRALPLIRYAIGDAVEGLERGMRFDRVCGRINEAVNLPDGTPVHSEAFTHVLRDITGIRAFQIVGRQGALPLIRYEAEAALPAERLALIAERLGRIDPALSASEVVRVESIPLSPAGKHKMVVSDQAL